MSKIKNEENRKCENQKQSCQNCTIYQNIKAIFLDSSFNTLENDCQKK